MIPLISHRLLLLLAVATLLAVALAAWQLAKRHKIRVLLCLVLAALLGTSTVAARINFIGKFAPTWGDLFSLITASNDSGDVVPIAAAKKANYHADFTEVTDRQIWAENLGGELLETTFRGPNSQVENRVFVWAPTGWQKMQNLPVVEFLHGFPGAPEKVPQQLELGKGISQLVQSGKIPPLLVVMPFLNADAQAPDCVDIAGRPAVGTWTARDIPELIKANFPVATDAQHWTLGGISAGAYCAGILSMQEPKTFGSTFIFSGYDHPLLGGLTNPQLQSEYTLTNMLQKSGAMNIYATAAGDDTEAIQLLKNLQNTARPQDIVVTDYSKVGAHNWETWAKDFARALPWKADLEQGKVHNSEFTNNWESHKLGIWSIFGVFALLALCSGIYIVRQLHKPRLAPESTTIIRRGGRNFMNYFQCGIFAAALMGGILLLINRSTQTVGGLTDISALLNLLGL